MRRRSLLGTLPGVLTAGCISRTGDPPPFPQPTFEYGSDRVDGATVITVTVVDDGGLTDEPVRILIGGTVAYANGSFRPSYENSSTYRNEWSDGLESGDSIRLTDGTTVGEPLEIEIQLRRADTGDFVAVGGDALESPSPSTGTETTTGGTR